MYDRIEYADGTIQEESLKDEVKEDVRKDSGVYAGSEQSLGRESDEMSLSQRGSNSKGSMKKGGSMLRKLRLSK